MGEIVNLRRVKKARERAAGAAVAAANRVLHGQTAGEKAGQRAARSKAARALDGARLDGDGEARE